jgi:hypothetical protein
MVQISQICQFREKELDKDFSDQLKDANTLFEDGNYDIAQNKLIAILQDLESQIKRIEKQKKLVTTEPTLALSKTSQPKPKTRPHTNIETRQKPQQKKNPATLFAPRKAIPFSMYALYLSLPATVIFFILYAFYNQFNLPPEPIHRIKW